MAETIKTVNVYEEMYFALKAVNKLVSEAAMTGFNWKDGDWAQRLFESQQGTSQAIRAYEACLQKNISNEVKP